MAAASNPKPTRAGMVCFNYAGQVLLVSGKTNHNEWLLPKGHIEDGEESYEAAEREVREEAGIRALSNPGASVGYTIYNQGEEAVITEWWQGLAQQCLAPSLEGRKVVWVSHQMALRMLTYPELKDVLKTALCIPSAEEVEAETSEE